MKLVEHVASMRETGGSENVLVGRFKEGIALKT